MTTTDRLTEPEQILRSAFEPAAFERAAVDVVALLTRHLRDAQARTPPVMPTGKPADLAAAFPAAFGPQGDGDLLGHIERALSSSTKLQSPRFVGHQVAAPLPPAAMCDFASSFVNQGVSVFEMGPAASAMERAVVQWMASLCGFDARASSGMLTSGGSLGNLTALLAARQRATTRGGGDAWRRGVKHGPQLCMFVADTAHYSVARAARILGLGDDGVVSIETDATLKMKPDALRAAVGDAVRRKRLPVAVVASAASTAAGACDPLEPIADICAAHGVWLHVDGAHGASLLLSERHRHKLKGIERADSVVWDAHKLMLMPALVTGVIFKDGRDGAAAFAQEAGYLFDDDADDGWAEIGRRTVECTKRMMSLKVYACLRAFGTDVFAAHVDRCCALATYLAAQARSRGMDVLCEPECNIVCFRPRGKGGGHIAAIRKRILDDGDFYLVQLHRGRDLWLRCTLLHPLTTEADLDALLDAVEQASSRPR